jgi:ABC-type Zn2+ transport system substrate-binding protein/surface adhesin
MTEQPNRAVDLHGFALREFLEFVRKEDPNWIDGAQVRRSEGDHHKAGRVDGKVWLEVLLSECGAQALARVLARAEAFDENEADAVLSLRKALRLGGIP